MKGKYDFVYSSRFEKEYKKLKKILDEEILLAINKFRHEENHKQLKLHKLTGEFHEYYAFSVNYKYRIMIKFVGNEVHFVDIGNHDIYK